MKIGRRLSRFFSSWWLALALGTPCLLLTFRSAFRCEWSMFVSFLALSVAVISSLSLSKRFRAVEDQVHEFMPRPVIETLADFRREILWEMRKLESSAPDGVDKEEFLKRFVVCLLLNNPLLGGMDCEKGEEYNLPAQKQMALMYARLEGADLRLVFLKDDDLKMLYERIREAQSQERLEGLTETKPGNMAKQYVELVMKWVNRKTDQLALPPQSMKLNKAESKVPFNLFILGRRLKGDDYRVTRALIAVIPTPYLKKAEEVRKRGLHTMSGGRIFAYATKGPRSSRMAKEIFDLIWEEAEAVGEQGNSPGGNSQHASG